MKKIIAVFLMLVVMLSWTSVDAASLCSYERQVELKKIASAVKLTYEEAQEEADPDTYGPPDNYKGDPEDYVLYNSYFKIKVLNLTEDIYIKIENSVNDDVKYIRYEDTDEGTFTLNWKDISKVTTFTYTIYSSDKTLCANEEYRKGIITLPKYNDKHQNVQCLEVPDFYLCQKYISVEVSNEQFYKQIESYKQSKNGADGNKNDEDIKNENLMANFIKKNKTALIIGLSVLIVGGGVAIVVVTKKRRSRVI